MKNLLKLTLLINMVMAAQENDVNASNADIEEVVVKGSVLYTDQVNALKTPVPVLEVPQSVSICLLYTSPSPRDATLSRMPSSA